ncbi:hypothetical protein VCR26J2_370010 [Vibrio coralliirubri]|nr:hypothetical protein VCR6J2_230129 [Vibrio coralliirubri]CDT15906.1 hypothetical protein VCR1J2_200796 [Vibrio coralliirubri]CDT74567.1 hypothetical protein VCR26J2_370010 [Vibrio coralliirubri]CDT97363.1 hypothetical protein VCR8J2_550011 [Vibrio coralliirubri]
MLSYTRFLEVMPSVLVPLSSFFTHVKGEPAGIEFIDSTSIKFVIIYVFLGIRFSKEQRQEVKGQWAGFMDLNFTSSPITLVISLPLS